MPFKKRGKYYYSKSGRKYTPRQVRAYYATDGWTKPLRHPKKRKHKKKKRRR